MWTVLEKCFIHMPDCSVMCMYVMYVNNVYDILIVIQLNYVIF